MDKEKDNSNIEEKVTISDLTEKAATMKQEEPKPKKRIGLGIMVTVLILLLVGGALAIGYLWGNNTTKPTNNTTETNNSTTSSGPTAEPESNKTETTATEPTESFKPLTFNADAIVNGDANQSYRVDISDRIGFTDGGAGYALYVSADSNNGYSKASVQVRWSSINKYYGSNHPIPEGSSTDDYGRFEVNFSQPITDIHIGGIGQMIGNESIFYLMEDGTVEKTDIKAAAEAGDFTSHTKVDGLEKIVKFYDVDAWPSNGNVGGYGTSAAQDIDGKIYLLFHIK